MTDREKAAEKVRKLRALAADAAATVPERELAAKRAADLVEKHSLSAAEVAPDPVRRRPPVPQPRQPAGFPFGHPFPNVNGFATGANSFVTVNGTPINLNGAHIHIIFR